MSARSHLYEGLRAEGYSSGEGNVAIDALVSEARAEGSASVSAAVEAAIGEVRYPHQDTCVVEMLPGEGDPCNCVLMFVRAALTSDAARKHDAAVRAEALRDAGVAFGRGEHVKAFEQYSNLSPASQVEMWLYGRADAEEQS